MFADSATATKHKTTHSTIIKLDVPFFLCTLGWTSQQFDTCTQDFMFVIIKQLTWDGADQSDAGGDGYEGRGDVSEGLHCAGEDASRLPCKYFLVSTHCCANTCDKDTLNSVSAIINVSLL